MGIGFAISILMMIIKACVGAVVGLVTFLVKGVWTCITGFFRFSKWAIKRLAGA